MAVRIRMKKLGRRHRPFYRICAMDSRNPRGGKVLEELGTYDPMIRDRNARAVLKGDRIEYWLGVGALPSDKVRVLIKKYGPNGTHLEQQKAALELLATPKAIPDPGTPASLPKKEEPAEAATEEPAAPAAPAEAATEEPTEAAVPEEAAPGEAAEVTAEASEEATDSSATEETSEETAEKQES